MSRCPLCGRSVAEDDHFRVGRTYQVLMLEDGRCIDCAYWPRVLHILLLRDAWRHPIVQGIHYIVADDGSSGVTYRGHGGRRHVLRSIIDGSVIVTHNLWHNGKIPPDLRLAMPDTHEIVEKEELP